MIWAIVAVSLLFSACNWAKDSGVGGNGVEGNGVVVEKSFDIIDVSQIKLDVPAEVTYTVADVPSMTVRLDENLMQYLTVSPDKRYLGLLTIESTQPLQNFKEFTIVLSTTSLTFLDCSHARSFKMKGTYGNKFGATEMIVNGVEDVDVERVEAGSFHLRVNGPGNVTIHSVKTPHLDLSVNAPGVFGRRGKVNPIRVSLAGEAERVEVKLSGPGEVDIANMDYKLLDKKVVGPGSVTTGDKPSYKSEPVSPYMPPIG